jgi:hypothetical protein
MYQALPDFLHIKDSPVAGQGIFAKDDIPEGVDLGMTHLNVCGIIYRTPLGGFVNHSDDPNCVKWEENQRYYMKSIRTIKKGEELFLKYSFYSVK